MKNKSDYIRLKAEYELVYADKEPKASILTNTLEAPLQEIRVFNEGNEWEDGWRNMLIFGDNLLALKTLYEDIREGGQNKYGLRNKIKLIYIDPPFATKQDFIKNKEKVYADKVAGAKFIEFLRKRIVFIKEILADDGSVFVHLDWKKGHYIKTIMDEIFGEHNFVNEIVWYYRRWNIEAPLYARNHDTIFFYAKKSGNHIWNQQFIPKSAKSSGKGKAWQSVIGENGIRRSILLSVISKGVPMPDMWEISMINPVGLERKSINYPTQKPEELLERIILGSSKEGEVILDCFAGSGTTLAVAEKLGRKWIGMDCGKLSIYTIQKRLLNLTTRIGAEQKDERLQVERIENFKEIENARGLFLITEKTKKGQLDLTDDFLFHLHALLKNINGLDFNTPRFSTTGYTNISFFIMMMYSSVI